MIWYWFHPCCLIGCRFKNQCSITLFLFYMYYYTKISTSQYRVLIKM